MSKLNHKLTLIRPETYQIMVPGHLGESWSIWAEEMDIMIDCDGADLPITTLTGTVDQAALHCLLRKLYAFGLPIISVKCIVVG